MKFVRFLLLVLPYRSVVAFPLSYTSAVAATQAYVPLTLIPVSLLFFVVVFFIIKLLYMQHRRIGSIHAPLSVTVRSIPTTSRNKQGNRHHGFLVGCLGSPTWETSLTSKLGRQQRRRSSFAYHLHTSTRSAHSASMRSNSGSRFTRSTAFASCPSQTDQIVLPSLCRSARIPGISSTLPPRNPSTKCRSRYGDFGELHRVKSPGSGLPNVTRRASPSSIRLVDGLSHSNQVEYSFLSALPPSAVAVSPLMGARDSFQLSRCSLQCNRKPVLPLPSLPTFLPFHLSKGPRPQALESRPLRVREYLPPLRFSPLASVARVFHSQQQGFEEAPRNRVANPSESETVACSGASCLESMSSSKAPAAGSLTGPWVTRGIPKPHPIRRINNMLNHRSSRSCKGLAIGGPSLGTPLVTHEAAILSLEDERRSESESMRMDVLRTSSNSSRNGSVASKKPLKSCLRQHSTLSVPPVSSPDTAFTPSMSETSSPTYGARQSTCDQVSLPTPISEDDVRMLGLDRFRWNDEIKELKVRSSHMKQDSIALVPLRRSNFTSKSDDESCLQNLAWR